MGIERAEQISGDKIIIHLSDKLPYGEPDRFWDISVTRDSEGRWQLPTITMEEIEKLPDDYPQEVQEAEMYHLEGVGTIVVIKQMDTDDRTWRYRSGGHTIVNGPYLLVESKADQHF